MLNSLYAYSALENFLRICGLFVWRFDSTRTKINVDNYSVVSDSDVVNMTGWQTYNNVTAGYSLKYPPEITVSSTPTNDRTVYFRSRNPMTNFAIFYQDVFDNKSVVISNDSSFTDEVNRRLAGLFSKGDDVVGHRTTFIEKPTIVYEDKSDSSREIFIWVNDKVLQIEIPGKMQSDQTLINNILSSITLN